jgi:hypothetical protein
MHRLKSLPRKHPEQAEPTPSFPPRRGKQLVLRHSGPAFDRGNRNLSHLVGNPRKKLQQPRCFLDKGFAFAFDDAAIAGDLGDVSPPQE